MDYISPGFPVDKFPTYYIDPDACIDCSLCETECPNGAIFEVDLIPENYQVDDEKTLSAPKDTPGFNEIYTGLDHDGGEIHLPAVRTIAAGDIMDLTPSIEENNFYFSKGPGYSTQ